MKALLLELLKLITAAGLAPSILYLFCSLSLKCKNLFGVVFLAALSSSYKQNHILSALLCLGLASDIDIDTDI